MILPCFDAPSPERRSCKLRWDGDFLPPFPFNDVELEVRSRIEANFPTRRMIMGRTANLSRVAKAQMDVGRQRCEQQLRCHHGCPLGSYFSTQAATLPAAVKTGNLTVLTDRVVVSVIHDPATGRVTGVRTMGRQDKKPEVFEARIVFLNASAINTAGSQFGHDVRRNLALADGAVGINHRHVDSRFTESRRQDVAANGRPRVKHAFPSL